MVSESSGWVTVGSREKKCCIPSEDLKQRSISAVASFYPKGEFSLLLCLPVRGLIS